MSDLLASLFIPGFFPEPPTDVHEAAMDGSGIEVQDVETYLNKPKNQAFLAASGTSSTKAKHSVTGGGYSAPQPVQLGGPKTSHHVTTLHHLCQSQGLVPEFEIGAQPEGGFGGMLRVGDATVTSYEGWSTKKEAKEALAEKGIPLVKGMKITGTGSAFGGESKNWIGLLMEYHCVPGSETGGVGANYIEYAIGLLFACTCTIPSHDIEFGSSTTPFSTKKAARNNAAKEAVQFLISQDLTNPDGTVKARKKASTPGQNVKMKGKSLAVKMDASFAQKVSDICPILGLTNPTYRISPTDPAAPNLLSGVAVFAGSPYFPEPIGEVRNIYGKKNAKEECARGVWKVLRKLARERGVEVEISSEEDDEYSV